MTNKKYIKQVLAVIALWALSATALSAANKTVTMQVGETMTLRLPSNITSLALRGAQWMSTRPNEVQVVSQTTYSATVKVLKAVPKTTTCLVNCRYYYLVNNGGFMYQLTGSYDFKVETESNEPTSVSLPSAVTLNVGEDRYLKASLTPYDAQTELTWSSSNYATVNVFQNGRILAQKAGRSVITVKTSNGKSASCTVVCQPVVPNLVLSDSNGIAEIPDVAHIRYDRKMYAGWNSICVPFALNQAMLDKFSEGLKMALVEEFEVVGQQRRVQIKEVSSVAAGVPCLVYAPSDVLCQFRLDNVELKASPDNSSILKASYRKTRIGAGVYKLTKDGAAFGLTKTDEAIVAPFRCYIQVQP